MHQQKIKRIMLIGQQRTGKTSIIRYLLKNRQFDQEYYPTVGVEAGIKTYQYDNGQFAVLQFWDSAGKHELHEYVCEKFYGDFDGFVIVTDLGNQNSMKAVNYWSSKIKRLRDSKGYIVGVVANKADLTQPQWTQADYYRMFPQKQFSNLKFYGKFSLKEVPEDKNKTKVEMVFEQFIRDLYGKQLPHIVVNEAPVNTGCTCSIM